MSRRHYIIAGGGGIPFEENLIFYAPLTEGDLTDHVSRTIGTQMSSCEMYYDDVKEAYKLVSKPNRSKYYVSPLCWTGLSTRLNTPPLTLSIDVAGVNQGNGYCAMLITPSWSIIQKNYNASYLGEVRFGGLDISFNRYAAVFEQNKDVVFYKNGVVTSHYGWWTLPNYTGDGSVAICMANDCNLYSIYAKNARIYNRALTASEVAQL